MRASDSNSSTNQRLELRSFIVKHQYKVLSASLFVGFMWIGIYHLLVKSWFFSRLSLLLTIICFVPAGLVLLVHLRAFGTMLWWDKSNVVLTTRRPRKIEKLEIIAMAALWTIIFGFVIVVIFVLSR